MWSVIFTTALPPAICTAATAAIRHLKTSQWERQRQRERTRRVKVALGAAGASGHAERHPHRSRGGRRYGEVQNSEATFC
jgi:7-keto-8-aminopelargonate synthetase-like enzyme